MKFTKTFKTGIGTYKVINSRNKKWRLGPHLFKEKDRYVFRICYRKDNDFIYCFEIFKYMK